MPSHNLAHIQIDDLDILGYSVAGEETVVALPQLDVCFDIGKAPDQLISVGHVLLTHGHMDHSAGFAYYLSQRKFSGMSPGTILVPANLIKPMRTIIDAWGQLDGNTVPVNLVGVRPGESYGQMFRLNPEVEDILGTYGMEGADGTKLLTLGTISTGGAGCFCPESALLKALMRHLVFKRDEIVIMDMAAGVEHLGRGTAEKVDLMLIVGLLVSYYLTFRIYIFLEELRADLGKVVREVALDQEDK